MSINSWLFSDENQSNFKNSLRILNIGVLLGSILGHLLFLIYINDIINSSNILLFVLLADDTTVYVQHDSIDGAI